MDKILKKPSTKIILGGLLAILLVISLWFALKPNTKKFSSSNDGKEIFAHTEEGIIKDEQLDGLKFTNISLITDKGYTSFTCDVTNTSEDNIDVSNVNIELKDKNDNTVVTLIGNIGSKLKPGELRVITASARGEFRNVVSKRISYVS